MNSNVELLGKFDALSRFVKEAPLTEPQKTDLMAAIDEAKRPLDTDVWIWRLIIGALAVIAVVPCVWGAIGPTPATFKDVLPLAAAALGGLVGLLAPSPVKSK